MGNLVKRLRGNKGNKGFSLVELVIVIAIMAVLIAILVPQFLKYVERSRESKDGANADELYRCVQIALADDTVAKSVNTSFTVTWLTTGGITTNFTAKGAAGTLSGDFIAELENALSVASGSIGVNGAAGSLSNGKFAGPVSAVHNTSGANTYVVSVTYTAAAGSAPSKIVVRGEWQ